MRRLAFGIVLGVAAMRLAFAFPGLESSPESSDLDVDEMDADADREKAHARQSIEPVRPINGRRDESPVA